MYVLFFIYIKHIDITKCFFFNSFSSCISRIIMGRHKSTDTYRLERHDESRGQYKNKNVHQRNT